MQCLVCGARAYSDHCVRHKPRTPLKRTPIKQRGKQYYKYQDWRDTVAIPYLDAHYGHICAVLGCFETQVDVDHIKERGSRPDLKYDVTNIRYLCRPHHRLITDGVKLEMK